MRNNQDHENNYEERINKYGTKSLYPKRVCQLQTDGGKMSFSFMWLHIVKSQEPIMNETIEHRDMQYRREMNGGIIFHGLGEPYSVSLDNSIGWQTHT